MAFIRTIFVFFTIAMLIAGGFVFGQDSTVAKSKKDTAAEVSSSSSSAIKSKVIYSSDDSICLDMKDQKMYLYGDAQVKYEDMELKAAYIEFDMTKNIAYSRGARDTSGKAVVDSVGKPIGDPVFSDAQKTFDAKEITYNFESKKGKIKDVTTQEGEAFIHAKIAKKDTGDVYYIKNGKYTTCDLDHPHFYLNATKLKIIRDDKIITGPANLVVADVPTPLALPFGVFPNKQGRKSGVIIPAYGESELGYFLKDGGYYFGINDNFDLTLKGDVYTQQSFAVKGNTNYSKRYKYNGSLGIDFAKIKISEKEFPDYSVHNDFFVRWRHVKDARSNPTLNFSANVNAGSSKYQTYNSNTTNDYLANTFQSNVALIKTWPGSPCNFSLNMSHSQNTIQRTVNVVLPEAAFSAGRITPFKRKNSTAKPNVLNKIGISPSILAKNQLNTIDTLLFRQNPIERFQNGIKTSVPISTSMNLGPLIITPSAGFTGYGYFQTINKQWSTDSDKVFIDTIHGFAKAYDYNASVSLSTKLFCFYSNRHGRIKTLRHVISPRASMSLHPDFSKYQYGYYSYVQTDTLGNTALYSIFENGIYGSPAPGKAGFISFSVNNNFELKLKPKESDTTGKDRKIVLVDNLSVSGGYNLAAEHYKWSNYIFSGTTKLFKVADVSLNGVIDPYVYDTALGKRIEKLMINQDHKIGRLTSAMLSVGASLQSLTKNKQTVNAKAKAKASPLYEDQYDYVMMHPDYYVDFTLPWDVVFSYNIMYERPAVRDTFIQTFSLSGNVNITDKWKVGFHSGFDFVHKNVTYTSFNIYRDLHCWEMRLDWIPFGLRKSYMLSVAVKASVLQDLKLSRKRDWYDYN